MAYKVVIPGKVQKQIDALSCPAWQQVRNTMDNLETNPRPRGYVKRKGETTLGVSEPVNIASFTPLRMTD